MYKWIIYFQLKNSPVDIRGVYVGPEDNSTAVFNRLFQNTGENTFIGLQGLDGESNILVRAGEVAAMRIAAREEDE